MLVLDFLRLLDRAGCFGGFAGFGFELGSGLLWVVELVPVPRATSTDCGLRENSKI